MGFWNKAGELALKAGKFAIKELQEAGERGKQYKLEMVDKNDTQLLKIIKNETNSSPLKAGAAHAELKSRGYDAETIKLMNA